MTKEEAPTVRSLPEAGKAQRARKMTKSGTSYFPFSGFNNWGRDSAKISRQETLHGQMNGVLSGQAGMLVVLFTTLIFLRRYLFRLHSYQPLKEALS